MPQDLSRGEQPGLGVTRRFASLRAIVALILREMATRYGRSPGGYIWALLEPIGGITVLSFGFSLLMRSPPIGNSFILFFATGFLIFGLYQDISAAVARSVQFSRPLLFYPAVTWVDAVLARFFLNMLTSLLVMLLLLGGMVIIVADTGVAINMGAVLEATSLAILLGLGLGMANCVIIGLFPIWAQIWSIATRPLFLMSCIIFLFEALPPFVQNILWYNPLVHVVGLMREGFYPTYAADYVSIPYVVSVSLILLFLGVVTMGRFHRDILNNG